MFILLSVTLTCCVVWQIFSPLISEEEQLPEPSIFERASLQAKKLALMQNLREYQLDFETGKISSVEFEKIKRSLSVELDGLIKQLN